MRIIEELGLKDEYENWKKTINDRVDITFDKLTPGMKFKVIKGPFKGQIGMIKKRVRDTCYCDFDDEKNVTLEEETFDYIRVF